MKLPHSDAAADASSPDAGEHPEHEPAHGRDHGDAAELRARMHDEIECAHPRASRDIMALLDEYERVLNDANDDERAQAASDWLQAALARVSGRLQQLMDDCSAMGLDGSLPAQPPGGSLH
jgi:hypothetical protein